MKETPPDNIIKLEIPLRTRSDVISKKILNPDWDNLSGEEQDRLLNEGMEIELRLALKLFINGDYSEDEMVDFIQNTESGQ